MKLLKTTAFLLIIAATKGLLNINNKFSPLNFNSFLYDYVRRLLNRILNDINKSTLFAIIYVLLLFFFHFVSFKQLKNIRSFYDNNKKH